MQLIITIICVRYYMKYLERPAMNILALLTLLILSPFYGFAAYAQQNDEILHIYSSRHYDTDEALYDNFTAQTGIKIQRVDGKADALIARLKQEGKASPADLFITVDSGRLWRAQEAGLFEPIQSDILKTRITDTIKDPKGHWFGFSKRARVIVYNAETVMPDEIKTYEDLTDAKWKGRVCIRSASNIYNLSLMASFIALHGQESAKEWAVGVLNNLARKPQGGDTDQIRAVAVGVCDVALVNSYYFLRLKRSDVQEDKDMIAKTDIIYPNQKTDGVHVNISGAGVLAHADNKEAAVKFLEYLATDQAQSYYASGNNEYPVLENIDVPDVLLPYMQFKSQDLNVSEFGVHQTQAQKIFDEINFP